MRIKYIAFIIILLFSSCYGIKFNGKKSAKKHYEVFFIDQGVLQYFVKPLEFKGDDEVFSVDFTFRDSVNYFSSVTTNYSIFTENPIKQVDSAFFVTNNEQIKLHNCERFFINIKKKTYQIRNSCTITYSQLIEITANETEFWAYYEGQKHVFIPTKKTSNILQGIKTQVIDIIELNKD